VSRASLTITLCFVVSVALFGAGTAYMISESRRIERAPLQADRAPTAPPITRIRFAVVVVTFALWSLTLSSHLRSRR
jgi:hypothetical protein